MEQNNFKTCLYLQVLREFNELTLKHIEDCNIAEVLTSFDQNENFIMEWIRQVDKFLNEITPQIHDTSLKKNYFWCNNVISRTRYLRAKRGPAFTFRFNSTTPISLREQLYYEITLLSNIQCNELMTNCDQEDKSSEEDVQKRTNEEDEFLKEIKLQLEEKVLDASCSDWYRNKIAETRTLIAKWNPAPFSLQSRQDEEGSSELLCEIRSLINMNSADIMTVIALQNDHDFDEYKKEIQEGIKEVKNFLTETNLQQKTSSNWYREKIAETRTLFAKRHSAFPFLSQDEGLTNSLSSQLEEGKSISRNFKPSLYQEVICAYMELVLKKTEDLHIAEIIGSYPNEKFHQVMKWTCEVDIFISEIERELLLSESLKTNSSWCNNMISRIRKVRDKRGPNFTFRMSDDHVGSSSTEPLSLREELYCEIMSLIRLFTALLTFFDELHDSQEQEFKQDLQEQIDELKYFFHEFKMPELKILDINSRWYCIKLAQARALISKFGPTFSLQSQYEDVGSSFSMPLLLLHEELGYEIRSLVRTKRVYMMASGWLLFEKYNKELMEQVNEVNKFLTEINLQFKENTPPQKNSNWYRNKIAQTRMLNIHKHYSAFPLRTTQHVGSSSINIMPTEEQYQTLSLQHLQLK